MFVLWYVALERVDARHERVVARRELLNVSLELLKVSEKFWHWQVESKVLGQTVGPAILHPRSQWQDAVNRFIDNYWDSPQLAAYRRRYPSNPPMVFVDWDDKGHATIDLSRALETDSDDSDDEADDSDDEAEADDSVSDDSDESGGD